MLSNCSIVLNWFVTEQRLRNSVFGELYEEFGNQIGVKLKNPKRWVIASDCYNSIDATMSIQKAFISVDSDSRRFTDIVNKDFAPRITSGRQLAMEISDLTEPFVLFSANDDHRLLADIPSVQSLIDVLSEFKDYPGYLSLPYSHLLEWRLRCLNSRSRFSHGLRLIDESEEFWVVESLFPVVESSHIHRTDDLVLWYSSVPAEFNAFRHEAIIRFIPFKSHLIIVPKRTEIFRHFEGSIHAKNLIGEPISFELAPPLLSEERAAHIETKVLQKFFRLNIGPGGKMVSLFDTNYPPIVEFEARQTSHFPSILKQTLNMMCRQYFPRRSGFK